MRAQCHKGKWGTALCGIQPTAMVVDDDPTARYLVCELLEQAGFTVTEAENGVQALSSFELVRPDVVLMDVLMPEMDGITACARLRALHGGWHIPIVLLTGLCDADWVHRAYEAGATDCLLKPVTWIMLERRIRHVLREEGAVAASVTNIALLT